MNWSFYTAEQLTRLHALPEDNVGVMVRDAMVGVRDLAKPLQAMVLDVIVFHLMGPEEREEAFLKGYEVKIMAAATIDMIREGVEAEPLRQRARVNLVAQAVYAAHAINEMAAYRTTIRWHKARDKSAAVA